MPNASESVEKQECSFTAAGKAKFGSFLQNSTYSYHVIQQ